MTDQPIEQPGADPHGVSEPKPARLMVLIRYVVPATIVLAGAIVMAFGSESDLEGGAGIIGAGLAVYAMNWLYRASVEGDRERDDEEAAREYLDAHGHWPDQRPAAGSPADAQPPRPASGRPGRSGETERLMPRTLARAPLGSSTRRTDRRRSHDARRPDGRR